LRNQQPSNTSDERQQNTLREQLTRYSLPARTQSCPYGHFLLAARGTCQQQVRNIGTSNEQYEAHRAEQHQQRTAYIAHHLLLQRHDVHPESRVTLVLLADPARNQVNVGLRLLDGNTGLQLHEYVVVFVTPLLLNIYSQGQRQEHIQLVHRFFRGHYLSGEHEVALQDASNDEGFAIERDALAENPRI